MVSQRKKKLNKSDFNKPKLKVGKTLPKNLNVTKIDLQTKKLIIKSQLKSGISEHSSVDKKKRTIPELLVKVCHMNENMRADAVTSLDEILFPLEAVNKSDLMANLSAIVRKLCVVLCDASLQVRKLACSLFGKICDSVSERDFEGLFDVFLAHLCNALTHVDEAIQKSALLLLYRGNNWVNLLSRVCMTKVYGYFSFCVTWIELKSVYWFKQKRTYSGKFYPSSTDQKQSVSKRACQNKDLFKMCF